MADRISVGASMRCKVCNKYLPDRCICPKPAADLRPKCGVRGLIQHGAMCSKVIVGGVYCGHSGTCQHKVEPKEQPHDR